MLSVCLVYISGIHTGMRVFYKRCFCGSTFEGVLSQLSRPPVASLVEPVSEIARSNGTSSRQDPVLGEHVSDAINRLLDAQNVWTGDVQPGTASLDDARLTPAQRFYLENKELLLKRATEYSVARASSELERATRDIEDEWAFYRDPVVRPPRRFLWPVSETDESSESSSGSEQFEFTKEEFPRIEEFVELLSREKVEDVLSVDLNLCGRRDIGEWAVIGTVKSCLHAERVGNLVRRAINRLGLGNIKTFINSVVQGQEWIVVRAGPVVVHLMTREDRDKYALEELYAVVPQDPLEQLE